MRQLSARVGVIVALVVLMVTASSPLTKAASPATNPEGAFNVVIAPITENLEVKPGGSVTTNLQVKNQGLATEHIKITVLKFSAYGQSGSPKILDAGPGDDFINWASFSSTRFDAEPNIWTPVTMTISPPKNAAFGYYYAVVFSRDGVQTKQKQANLLGAVANLVLLDVQAPGAVRQAAITQFKTDRNVTEFLPATFSVQMHNTGNVHVAPRGNIFITKGGKNVALLEVNLHKGNILPKSYRVFTAAWDDGTPAYKVKTANGKTVLNKADQPVTSLDWSNFNLSKLRFGKYDAKLVMVYNDGKGDVSSEAHLSFWVIPWRIIAGTLILLVLIGGGIWALIWRPARRRLRKEGRYVG